MPTRSGILLSGNLIVFQIQSKGHFLKNSVSERGFNLEPAIY